MIKVIEVDFVADTGRFNSEYHPLFVIGLNKIGDLFKIVEKQNIPIIFKRDEVYICSDGKFMYTCWVKENKES